MFPYEYQRALKQIAEKEAAGQTTSEKPKVEVKPPEPTVRDIEESVTDTTMEKKRLEKILDKTRYSFWRRIDRPDWKELEAFCL